MPMQGIAPGSVAPDEMAATVPGAATLGLPAETKQQFSRILGLQPERNQGELYAIFKADRLSRFYVPAVMTGHDSPPPPSARTVHVLGRDEKSKFVAHALHGIYDSVQAIDMSANNKYLRVTGRLGNKEHQGSWIEHNKGLEEAADATPDEGHISNLVVGGRPSEAVKLLKKVKHRVDERTAICLIQDGLGLAERVNTEIFTNARRRPSIVLGHMKHKLAYNRKADSVQVMKPDYATALTAVRPHVPDTAEDAEPLTDTWLRTQGMLQKFAAADLLRARGVQLENWMKLKIPSLMFSAVVDPICVMLDASYQDLIRNATAQRLMDQLLAEIAEVVGRMHETKRAPGLERMIAGEKMRKDIYYKLRGKGDAPSKMVLQIERGHLTDIDYLNGYFVARGASYGLDMPANTMVMNMVKSKHKAKLMGLRSWIPLEETSRR
ncbi:putative 2-dehydropantoate 2-reductase [Colletotrichum sidae]|nr:putative 2-dehydropantoate 2-reductase [Colletotrichum sidae]